MTTPIDLDAIKARAEAATEGPWRRYGMAGVGAADFDIVEERRVQCDGCDEPVALTGCVSLADAEFITAARTDVPALVAEVERLRGACHLSMSALKDACDVLFEASGLDAEYESETDLIHETVLGLARERDTALAQLGAIAALVEKYESSWEPDATRIGDRIRAILADSAGAIAKHEQEVRAAWAAEVGSAMERLIDLRSDYLPGLTGAQVPHLDLIEHEIATVRLVLRILRDGGARGWAHSSRWAELDGLAVLARADALTEAP